jgi:hypothetical protein
MFSWLFFGPMLSRYEHSSPYFSIVTYIIPTLLGRLRHLPFVQKMIDNALIHEVCIVHQSIVLVFHERLVGKFFFVVLFSSLTYQISVCSNGFHFYHVIILTNFYHFILREHILALDEDCISCSSDRKALRRYILFFDVVSKNE